MTTHIFISYRRVDSQWAMVAIRNHIRRHYPGAEVFADIATIKPGDDFVEVINHHVDQCEIMLALIGPNWLGISDNDGRRRLDKENDFVRLEIARALERGIRLIPVMIDGATMPQPSSLPPDISSLARRNGFTVAPHSNERDLDELCEFLGNELGLEKGVHAAPLPPETDDDKTATAHPGEVAQALLDAGVDGKTMVSVADKFENDGKFAIAEEIRRTAGPLLIQSEGENSVWELSNRHNLASAILDQGRAAEAQAMFADLLPLREKVQGAEHPSTLATRHELARAILNQGRATEAEAMLADLLPLEEKVLGAEHPSTLAARQNLASAILNQGRAAVAEAMLADLLLLAEKVQGAEHPSTLTTRHQLATAILNQGRAAEAEAMLADLLPLREKVQGAEHPATLVARHNLAHAILDQGRAAEAEAMLADLLLLAEKVQGAEDPGTLGTRRTLAQARLETNDPEGVREALQPLPADGGDPNPLRIGQTFKLRGWLADLDGDANAARDWLDRAGASLDHLAPDHYARRELARYLHTRVPGQAGGTMIRAADAGDTQS